jgi:hypothetical protein
MTEVYETHSSNVVSKMPPAARRGAPVFAALLGFAMFALPVCATTLISVIA